MMMQKQQGFSWMRALIATIIFVCLFVLVIQHLFPRIQHTKRERQLLACRSEKPIITMPTIISKPLKSLQGGLVTFWFTNAWQSQYDIAYPLLKKYGYVAVVAVPTATICQKQAMTWAELRQLQKSGWGISSMGKKFSCELSVVSKRNVQQQLHDSKKILRQHGLYSPTFTVPCGYQLYVNKSLQELVPSFYHAAIQAQPQLNFPSYWQPFQTYAFSINQSTPIKTIAHWLQQAKQKNAWIILKFNRVHQSEQLEKVLALVKQSDIQVVLPRQILQKS